MEQNTDSKNKPSHISSNDYQQGYQDHSVETGLSFQQMVLEKLDIHMPKNKTGPLPWSIYKN